MTAATQNSMVEELMSGYQTKVAEIQSRSSKVEEEILKQMSEVEERMETAATKEEVEESNIMMTILTDKLQDVRNRDRKEEKDFAESVFCLNGIINSMGNEYEEMTKLNAEEQAIIDKAKAVLSRAKQAHQKALEELETAKAAIFFRSGKIKTAEKEVGLCQTAIKRAEQGIIDAETRAKQMARKRLLSATMEQSLQEFQLQVSQTVEIMQKRMEEIHGQVEIVGARLKQSQITKEAAAEALTKLRQKMEDTEKELQQQESLLDTFVNGTPEYTSQETRISNIRNEVEVIRGLHNNSFILYQSKEKFVTELEIHLRSQTKLRDNQRMWITALRSDTEERVVTFRSRLEAMKAMSDMDIAKNLDKVGAKFDQSNATYMATAGAVAEDMRMDKVEDHPERQRMMDEVKRAQLKAVQEIRRREAKSLEDFEKKYNIDPMKSSFFEDVA